MKQWTRACLGIFAIAASAGLCVFEGLRESTRRDPIIEVLEPYDLANSGKVGDVSDRLSGRRLTGVESASSSETTEYDFYGFYGFYGVTLPATVDCDALVLKISLYNYGARDLTHVNTIRYIIENARKAVDATYMQAVPNGSTKDFATKVTELDGSAVTYVTVTMEVDFQTGRLSHRAARELGGTFASFLGVSAADQSSSGGYVYAPPAPTSGKGSVGVDVVVTGYVADDILDDTNELIAFQAVVQASFQTAVKQAVGSAASRGANTQLIGLIEAGESDSSAVAARVFAYFATEGDAQKFQDVLENDPTSLEWGALDGRVRVIMTVPTSDATFVDAFGREVEVRPSSSDDSSKRRLLSYGGQSNAVISESLSKAGLGVGSIDPSQLECKISDGRWDSDSDGSVQPSSFYGMYGFYGSELSSGSMPSSAITSSGGSFYGYSPEASKPVPSTPAKPPQALQPPAPVGDVIDTVNFTTVLADYNIADLQTDEDMAQFEADYIAALEEALKVLGITSDPVVEILDVLSASIAVPTTVTFYNDPVGARLFTEVLQSNPSLAFPSFDGLGELVIIDVNEQVPGTEFRASQQQPARQQGPSLLDAVVGGTSGAECPVSLSGETCCEPAALDARAECCRKGVDECGVCGGQSDTCAVSGTARVGAAHPGLITSDPGSEVFKAMLEDFAAGTASLFESFRVRADDVEIDEAAVSAHRGADGALEFDIPFVINPPSTGTSSVPKLAVFRSIIGAAAEQKVEADGITVLALLDASRSGICGNNVCEIGEFPAAAGHSLRWSCPADCPDYVACPSGPGGPCSGHGMCTSSSGECRCFAGYEGPDCSACADGFAKEWPGGPCKVLADEDGLVRGTEAGAPPLATAMDGDGETYANTTLVLIVIGTVGAIAAIIMIYYFVVLRKRWSNYHEDTDAGFAPVSSPSVSLQEPLQVPIVVNHDPDVPTRQLTENSV